MPETLGNSDVSSSQRPRSFLGWRETKSLRNGPLMRCRHCGTNTSHVMADLGMQPVANALRADTDLFRMEPTYPLRVLVCPSCLLAQAQEVQSAQELFGADYTYFSSFAASLVEQAHQYALRSIGRFSLGKQSRVVEVACNDGYLLRWFQEAGIPVVGIEPTANTAAAARALGIPVYTRFFGEKVALEMASEGLQADLMPANNVVAHVPDINDFITGFRVLLKPDGVASFEFHHILNLLRKNQFDSIYHEHYYYHSLRTFTNILATCGLRVFDVEKIPSHGGSLRVYAQRADTGLRPITASVQAVLDEETRAGLDSLASYLELEQSVREMKRKFLQNLLNLKAAGKSIVAYGAPAKGNTLLNYTGVRTDFIDYAVDRSPHKQHHYLPGSQIPIYPPEMISETRPDYVLIMAWNLADEIEAQMSHIRQWGGQFMTLIPQIRVW